MNQLQFGLFIVFVISVFVSGNGILSFLDKDEKSLLKTNRSLYIGEVLLIGSIFLIGQFLVLSLVGLYKGGYLWTVVLVNYSFLFGKDVRNRIFCIFKKKISNIVPSLLFVLLAFILFFRNCYFMFDVDSLSSYLFAQKLWLTFGTSIFGNPGYDIRIFAPHFNAVPYGLGLAIFGQETLFPQFIDVFWRLIVLLLVFGYTSFRLNKYYGLAAVMFVLFKEHFFYSGVNSCVILNGAVIALTFAAAYNFWESKRQDSPLRFLLANIFLIQIMSNKLQLAYVVVLFLILGVFIQNNPYQVARKLFHNKIYRIAILVSLVFLSTWFIRNFLVTRDPFFPAFAGRLQVFNWSIEQEANFAKVVAGSLSPMKFLKYFNYFFIWAGINAAKYVVVVISLFPILILIQNRIAKEEKEFFRELCYWLTLCIMSIIGICLMHFVDPRVYSYVIGIFAFTAVFSIRYVLRYCFNLKNEIIVAAVVIVLSLQGFSLIYKGFLETPTFKENIQVIFNKIHMDDVIRKHKLCPDIYKLKEEIAKNTDKFAYSAWDLKSFSLNIPAFLLPVRPVVSLWCNSLVKWKSYTSEKLILKDLKDNDIKWVMQAKECSLIFLPVEAFAAEAVKYDRFPKDLLWNYNFPEELARIRY